VSGDFVDLTLSVLDELGADYIITHRIFIGESGDHCASCNVEIGQQHLPDCEIYPEQAISYSSCRLPLREGAGMAGGKL